MKRLTLVVVALLLLGPPIYFTAPGLMSEIRLAVNLRGRTFEERRSFIFGPYYVDLSEINGLIPAGAPASVVAVRPADRDIAMFAVYQLYPRSVRVYKSIDAWSANTDGESARPLAPFPWVILIDQSRQPMITLLHRDMTGYRKVATR